MSLARTLAVTLAGIDGSLVEVQCHISNGLPGLSFTGLADTSVVEARERIRSAIVNSGADWPQTRITMALLPADLRKVGARFDLALAVSVLAAGGQIPASAVEGAVWIAELGLDGALRPVTGVLPAVHCARRRGAKRVVVAAANAAEAALVTGIDVRSADRLGDVIGWLTAAGPALPAAHGATDAVPEDSPYGDLRDVAGQGAAKRAVAVAAAGAHHLFLVGAPGSGKTMLAERLPGVLPALDDAAALEVTAVHSVAGLLGHEARLIRRPPLQAPHHSASTAALVGGGSHLARPGALSLAHRGVLFLDEAAEFAPAALDALRQPLESGAIVLHRSGGTVRYPARVQLVLATNPCPCGLRPPACVCPPGARRRYRQRLSGPLLDRVDLRVQVDPVPTAHLFDPTLRGADTATVRDQVVQARLAARERWAFVGAQVNSEISGTTLRSSPWALPPAVLAPAFRLFDKGQLSARGLDRILRIGWTLADLAGRVSPGREEINEALFFRVGVDAATAA